ncbi:splicing factor 3B subunit 5/RDS3 complex subunit 10 [Kipferlia bialata]|uniref:Splicing factor 3B subunit 5/RDS3 complex subunit 10 n=1 Tax=Kipferlia bialata TaxID=797122 RepID=A0A9K3CLG4_9EUKA|nr:splicing factor 3B subunit 5/RDS3 complex subunit 10 [Kipferlia bialata]|eukprot:g41.t1
MSEGKYALNTYLQQLCIKHPSTGGADTERHEFACNVKRDSYATYISHPGILQYMSVAQNQSVARQRFHFVQSMIQPCGPPPSEEEW